jgi:hypothetical protein
MNEQLNHKDSYGRIYAYKKGSDYFSKTISPYHPKFIEQIEEGIKDIVFSFLNKNYIVLGSCEGHSKSFNSAQITLAFPVSDDRTIVVNSLKNIPFLNFEFFDKFFDQTNNNTYEIEAKTINDLYFKKNKRYYFLKIVFFKYKYSHVEWPYSYHFFNFLIPLNGLFVNYLKKKYENQVKNMVINIINSERFPIYDK